MRLILNQNVSPQIAGDLRRLGHEVEIAPPGVPDEDIPDHAAHNGGSVVTCDEDFGTLVFLQGAPSAGVVKLSLRNNSAVNQASVLKRALANGSIVPGRFVKLTDADLR